MSNKKNNLDSFHLIGTMVLHNNNIDTDFVLNNKILWGEVLIDIIKMNKNLWTINLRIITYYSIGKNKLEKDFIVISLFSCYGSYCKVKNKENSIKRSRTKCWNK